MIVILLKIPCNVSRPGFCLLVHFVCVYFLVVIVVFLPLAGLPRVEKCNEEFRKNGFRGYVKV